MAKRGRPKSLNPKPKYLKSTKLKGTAGSSYFAYVAKEYGEDLATYVYRQHLPMDDACTKNDERKEEKAALMYHARVFYNKKLTEPISENQH